MSQTTAIQWNIFSNIKMPFIQNDLNNQTYDKIFETGHCKTYKTKYVPSQDSD